MYSYCANNPIIYSDPTGHVWMYNAGGILQDIDSKDVSGATQVGYTLATGNVTMYNSGGLSGQVSVTDIERAQQVGFTLPQVIYSNTDTVNINSGGIINLSDVKTLNVGSNGVVSIDNRGYINGIYTGANSSTSINNSGHIGVISSGTESKTNIENIGYIGIFNTGAKSTNEVANDGYVGVVNTGLNNTTKLTGSGFYFYTKGQGKLITSTCMDAVLGFSRGIDEGVFGGVATNVGDFFRGLLGIEKNNWEYLYENNSAYRTGYDIGYAIGTGGSIASGAYYLTKGLKIIATYKGIAIATSNGEVVTIITGSLEGVIEAAKGLGISLMAIGNADKGGSNAAWSKVDDSDLSKLGNPGNSKDIRVIKGSASDADAFFKAQVDPSTIKEVKPGVFVGKDANGVTFTYRAASKSGPPTIDVNGAGSEIRKIKFTEDGLNK